MLRFVPFILLSALAAQVWANDALWGRLKTETGLVVLMRHTQPAGGNPLTWDESGNCRGESMLTADGRAHAKRIGEDPVTDGSLREIATADPGRTKAFERKAQSLIGSRRGPIPVVLVSHRPNIDLLTMELIESGELLVGRLSDKGEIDVLGKIKLE